MGSRYWVNFGVFTEDGRAGEGSAEQVFAVGDFLSRTKADGASVVVRSFTYLRDAED